jgi:hypothetical protein
MEFKEWFEQNLVVGPMPDEYFDINQYDYIINVSDEYVPYRPNLVFWFPMNECKKDIGLNSIYGALTILKRAYNHNRTVYLHCHAGINRSQTVRSAFYFMMTETHFEREYNSYKNVLIKNCAYGYLPPINEMEDFLKMFKEYGDGACSLDKLKLKTIDKK